LEAAAKGFQNTTPLSPGMIGWRVEEGQPLIFDLMDKAQIGVELTPYNLMIPWKPPAMIIGISPGIASGERIYDYCYMRETCRCQNHYDQAQDRDKHNYC